MFPRFKRSPAYAPGIMGYTSGSTPLECVTHIPGSESRECFHWSARLLPRAPLPHRGVTSAGVMSLITSKGATLSSSLLWAHAPHQNPPADFNLSYTAGLCRLLRAPAGSWWFPTLSPQTLHRCWDPYPATTFRCSYPFLPGWLRPHARDDAFGS